MKKTNKILLELYNDRKQLLFMSFLTYISMLAGDLTPSDPHVVQATAAIATVVVAAIGVGVTAYNAHKSRKQADELATKAEETQTAETTKLEAQKKEFKEMKFTNPYENLENRFEGLQNTYEDLTVNQQEAQFQAQQGAQQRANIMQGLRSAAGGSGIAGLAQAMANQGQLQTQRISASIGQQESRNQALRAQGAASIQQQAASGAAAIDSLKAGGEQWVQEKEIDRQATLLGMQMGASAGANLGAQSASQYQQQMRMAEQQTYAEGMGMLAETTSKMDFSGGGGGNPQMSVNPDYDPSLTGQDVSFGGNTYSTSG